MSQLPTIIASFNKARPGYLFAELLAIREALIGSQALIALVETGCAPESLALAICETTKTQTDPTVRPHQDSLVVINEYVSQAAAGDALLRLAGQDLPPAPVVPGGDVLEAFHMPRYALPDYEPLWDHLRAKQSVNGLDETWNCGFGTGDVKWQVRLTAVLQLLVNRYLNMIVAEAVLFEFEDGIFKCPQHILDEARATVEPLTNPRANLAATASMPHSRAYMEHLRSRGASAMRVLGRYAREQGNEHVKRGDATREGDLIPLFDRREAAAPVTPGVKNVVDKEFCYAAARADYSDAARVPEESAVTLCNLAAVFLKTKDYDIAWQMCQSSLEALERLKHGAPTYGTKRASCIRAISTGYTPEVPAGLRPASTVAEEKARKTIAFKAHMRYAKAYGGLMQQQMAAGHRPAEVKKTYETAAKACFQALKINPTDPLPDKERDALLSAFKAYEKDWIY